MKVCVLQPDYSTTAVDYQHYDPPRDLQGLLPDDEVHHVFLNKLATYRQLQSLQHRGYDIFVNLCEGYLEWEVPSIDVIYTLDLLQLPYTGPSALLYDPPKEIMKYVAYCEGVKTPGYALIASRADIDPALQQLSFPLFIKPAKAGDSLGIDADSLVYTKDAVEKKTGELLKEYDSLLLEEYIDGREFTVLVAAGINGKTVRSFQPVEYIFPEGFAFKTYSLKTSELHPDANIACTDKAIATQLKTAAEKIFLAFKGVGYARLDFRMNDQGELFFLEINFTCSVFYRDGYEGSADHILKQDGCGQQQFLQHIIAEGIARHQRTKKKYRRKGNAIAGYGIYAIQPLQPGEIIFDGEEKAQKIVTRRFVEQHWKPSDKETFRRYAYPLSSEVFLLWDDNPYNWAPQNHSCEPNTIYKGLNVITLRTVAAGEELTLDYADFLDEHMEPFSCRCGATECRGVVTGRSANSVTEREKQASP